MADVEVECLDTATLKWYELPEDSKEEILACLPLEWLCKSRGICSENLVTKNLAYDCTMCGLDPYDHR